MYLWHVSNTSQYKKIFMWFHDEGTPRAASIKTHKCNLKGHSLHNILLEKSCILSNELIDQNKLTNQNQKTQEKTTQHKDESGDMLLIT